jgi:hypothetical protein
MMARGEVSQCFVIICFHIILTVILDTDRPEKGGAGGVFVEGYRRMEMPTLHVLQSNAKPCDLDHMT